MRIKNEAEENNKINLNVHRYISSTGMGSCNLQVEDPQYKCWITGSENIKRRFFTYYGTNTLVFKYYIL